MTIITQKQYNEMVKAVIAAERESLAGNRAQVFFDTESGEIWLAHLGENEHYPDDGNYVVIYAVEPWENKLKDLYEDENADVDWDDENYKFTPEYEEFENWYFDDVDGFAWYKIIDDAMTENDIKSEHAVLEAELKARRR